MYINLSADTFCAELLAKRGEIAPTKRGEKIAPTEKRRKNSSH